MSKSLVSIIAAGLLALSSHAKADNNDTLKYSFRAASQVPFLNLVALLIGEIKYYKNSTEIYGEINPTGGLAKIFDKDIKHRIYSTIFYRDSIVYSQDGDSLADSLKTIKKSLNRNSPYFDALTSVSILLDYIEGDSLEYHKLIKNGSITLFVDNKIISAKLTSLKYEKIKYKGEEVTARKLSVERCPDDRTFFDIIIYDKKIIKLHCLIKRGLGINFNAELKE